MINPNVCGLRLTCRRAANSAGWRDRGQPNPFWITFFSFR